ncbi:MAG TPA: snapalysin family zinc-dependent metalloprotease [Amycolatopsis sp.]|uniref:snapalysin family zinc-dependent metalloprotease n=1 Tax=Amycolatopsis sp. TaxID=37632 RepID=UPI002B4A3605|nr:snapalysin family zinc-dependent metalloprotease [Amycolatopsis sp.]HKS48352.1 snapalysin family zinc-dependent metalloprotease [Amycolatopsis sp.]
MLRRTFAGVLAGTVLAVPMVVVAPSAAAAVEGQATTLTYDDSQAAEFKSAVAAGVNVWNTSVTNVRIVKAQPGQRVNIQVVADDDWPRANLGPVRPTGTVTVWIGREAVDQGYYTVRIAAHELGHSLGLPDAKPGPCSSLMSGSTGGVSCTNVQPNASEKAAVQHNYAGTAQSADTNAVLPDAAH